MNIFIGLGTNLGDRDMNLIKAKDLLMKYNVMVIGQSDVLETKPLGGLDQPLYLNQVLECQTDLSPMDLFVACKQVEVEMGRKGVQVPGLLGIGLGHRNSMESMDRFVGFGENITGGNYNEVEPVWESRIIDIDILFYADQIVKENGLTIPHPRMHERDFVLKGMLELDSQFQHPVLKETMEKLYEKVLA